MPIQEHNGPDPRVGLESSGTDRPRVTTDRPRVTTDRPRVTTDRPRVVTTVRGWGSAPLGLAFTALNAALAVAAVYAPLRRLLAANAAAVNPWWGYTGAEWLLNYGGGPVRRGFAGEVLRHLPFSSDRAAVTALVVALAVVVPLLFALLVQLAGRATQTGWPLLLWGIPGGLLLGTWQEHWLPLSSSQILFATRKEYAFFAALLLLAIGLGLTNRVRLMAILFTGVMLLGALSHEALTIPFAVAGGALVFFAGREQTFSQGSWARGTGPWRSAQGLGRRDWPQLVNLAIIGIPVGVAVGFAALLPTATDARITRQWDALDGVTREWLGSDLPWPFRWLGFTLKDAVESTIVYMVRPEMLPVWLMVGACVALWTVAALSLVDQSADAVKSSLAVAGVMTLALFPLAAAGIDWGRFIVIAATCTSIVLLGRQLHHPPASRPAPLNAVTVLAAAVLIAVLGFLAVPEAGPPLGELRGVAVQQG